MAAAVRHVALSISRQAEGKSEVIVLKLPWACTSWGHFMGMHLRPASLGRVSHGPVPCRRHLMGVHLMGVHLTGVHLMDLSPRPNYGDSCGGRRIFKQSWQVFGYPGLSVI